MNWIKHPLEPHHQGVPSGASKMISELAVCLAQTVHLSCTDTTLSPNWPKWDSTRPTPPLSSIECVQNDFWGCVTFGINHAPTLREDWPNLRMDWIMLALEPRHLGVPPGASKTISEPKVRLAQTVHLSCIDSNTISKRTDTRFHMTHVT
jgi:hypothetical protein